MKYYAFSRREMANLGGYTREFTIWSGAAGILAGVLASSCWLAFTGNEVSQMHCTFIFAAAAVFLVASIVAACHGYAGRAAMKKFMEERIIEDEDCDE